MGNKDLIFEKTYNQRLFSGGLRGWFHMARFVWLRRKCEEFGADTSCVVELGCFDARSIEHLPTPPAEYYGYDAGWEGGLALAAEKYRGKERYVFQKCLAPEELAFPEGKKATLAISLETLEHIPPELLLGYLDRLRDITSGYLFVSVPNEKGLVLLVKYILKELFYPGKESYTAREVMHATLGNMSKVRREEHKGFDWEELRDQIAARFDLVKVEGVQFPWLPKSANVQIGMVFKSRAGR